MFALSISHMVIYGLIIASGWVGRVNDAQSRLKIGVLKNMAMRKIITSENPILRQKAKKVHRFDPSLQKLVDDMFETMHDANGVGLAAPQIGMSIRVFVAEYEDRKIAVFNPEI